MRDMLLLPALQPCIYKCRVFCLPALPCRPPCCSCLRSNLSLPALQSVPTCAPICACLRSNLCLPALQSVPAYAPICPCLCSDLSLPACGPAGSLATLELSGGAEAQAGGKGRDLWRNGYWLEPAQLPSAFISEQLAQKVLRAGKSINFLQVRPSAAWWCAPLLCAPSVAASAMQSLAHLHLTSPAPVALLRAPFCALPFAIPSPTCIAVRAKVQRCLVQQSPGLRG